MDGAGISQPKNPQVLTVKADRYRPPTLTCIVRHYVLLPRCYQGRTNQPQLHPLREYLVGLHSCHPIAHSTLRKITWRAAEQAEQLLASPLGFGLSDTCAGCGSKDETELERAYRLDSEEVSLVLGDHRRAD